MFESMFGMELPLPAKLVVAFVIVLALIAASMWVLRRIGGGRLTTQSARGRQPRLAVIDAAAVDSRRRLVLIRRDNVEHLVMIGGPSDVVIEQNIVRAVPVAPPRDAPRPPGPEAARPPSEVASPLPPDASRPPAPALVRTLPQTAPDSGPRPVRPADGGRRTAERESARPEPVPALRVLPGEPRPDRPEARPGETQPPAAGNVGPPAVEASLADMAHKLEAALRRPGAPRRNEAAPAEHEAAPPSEPAPSTAPESDGAAGQRPPQAGPPPPRAAGNGENAPPRAEAKPGAARSVFDSLEEEMASLLNRTGGKEQ